MLLLQRPRILRCIAGTLSADEERRLRHHLGRCRSCRCYYDEVSAAAEALGSAAGRRRERARLTLALDRPADTGGGGAPLRRRWWLPALAVAAAAGVLLVRLPALHPPAPSVTERGGGEADPGTLRLLLYASRKGPPGLFPVHPIADFPGAGEARASLQDYLQLGYDGVPWPGYLTVVGVDETGQVHQYLPRPGADPPMVKPSEGPHGVGSSINLGIKHRSGRLRLFALFSSHPLDEGRVRAAAAQAGVSCATLTLPGEPIWQVTGLLTLEP